MSVKLVRRRRSLIALAVGFLPLILSGCFKFTMDLEVSSDDKISGTAVVALSKELAAFAEESGGDSTDVFEDIEGIVASEFDDGTFVGQQYEFEGLPIEELDFQDESGGLSITRDGDFLRVSGDLNFEDDSAGEGADDFGFGAAFFESMDLRVSIKFPGEVQETNGELNSETNTVTWLPKYGQANEISATVYAPRGVPIWIWILSASALVAIVAAMFVARMLRNRSSSEAGGSQISPAGTIPREPTLVEPISDESVRFKYSIRSSVGPKAWFGLGPTEVMEIVLGREKLLCTVKDPRSEQVISSDAFQVSEITDAVFISDAANGMVVRLTVSGGIVDIPARPGDGNTLIGLLNKGDKASSKPVAEAPPKAPQSSKDEIEQIEKLFELKEKGVISVEEFEQKKSQILRRL